MIRFSVSRLLQAPSGPPGCALTPRASISPFRCNQATGQRGLWPELGCIGSSKSFSTQARSRSKSFEEYRKTAGLKKQEDFIRLDKANCSPNYLPTPVVISRGEGVYVWDTEGNKYFDFVCGISVRYMRTIRATAGTQMLQLHARPATGSRSCCQKKHQRQQQLQQQQHKHASPFPPCTLPRLPRL